MQIVKFRRSKAYKIRTLPSFGKGGDLNICEDVSYVHAMFYHETAFELTETYSGKLKKPVGTYQCVGIYLFCK